MHSFGNRCGFAHAYIQQISVLLCLHMLHTNSSIFPLVSFPWKALELLTNTRYFLSRSKTILSATMYKRVICDCIVVPGYCESRKQLCNWNYSCGIRLWPGIWEVDWGCRLRSKSRGSLWFPPWLRLVLVCCCVYCYFQAENSPLTNTFDSLEEGIECFDTLVLALSCHNWEPKPDMEPTITMTTRTMNWNWKENEWSKQKVFNWQFT